MTQSHLLPKLHKRAKKNYCYSKPVSKSVESTIIILYNIQLLRRSHLLIKDFCRSLRWSFVVPILSLIEALRLLERFKTIHTFPVNYSLF